jgi:tRNA-2-methylthio-N6-dimethylallyladenosine synthase
VKRYHVTTFGCQMNAHDSERIKGMLEELGLGEAPAQADADVLVFNTCTIREKPDQRFAAHLAQARALKERDPEKVIAVGGCYAEAQRERLFELYPYVDVAFGPGSIPQLRPRQPAIRRQPADAP